MSDLVKSIFGEKVHNLKTPISKWIKNSKRFEDFLEKNKKKLTKKVKTSNGEFYLEDVLAEIRVAYLILLNEFCTLDYEIYGSNNGGPDFKVTYNDTSLLNIEVKNIRKNIHSVLFDRKINEIKSHINQIHSNFYYSIEINVKDYNVGLVQKIEEHFNQIVQYIIDKSKDPLSCRTKDEIYEYDIEPFGQELKLLLCESNQAKKSKLIARMPSSTHIPFTQKEFKKLSSTILEKVHQLKNDVPNIILIYTDNYHYERLDLNRGLEKLMDLISSENNDFFNKPKYGFSNAREFKFLFKNLCGILFLTEYDSHYTTYNYFIENPLKSDVQNIEKNLLNHLTSMREKITPARKG